MVFKKIWRFFERIQQRIDPTAFLLRLSAKFAKEKRVSVPLFILFFVIGLSGLFLPLIQGIPTIVLSFTFLGIKPVNKFMHNNKQLVSKTSTLFFIFFVFFLLGSTSAWALGITEDSPVDNLFKVVNWGKESLQDQNEQAFSLVGVDYINFQQSLSIIDYSQTQGFTIGGS